MKPISEEEFQESILIASILDNPGVCFHLVQPTIKGEHFTHSTARACWMSICKNYRDGEVDHAEVYRDMLTAADKAWFFDVTGNVIPVGKAVTGTASAICKAAKLRRLSEALSKMAAGAKASTADPDWVLEDMLSLFRSETGTADKDCSIAKVMSRFDLVQERNKVCGSMGKRTGFELLQHDYITYQPGHLWVIGAWTSVGKSTLMVEAVNRFLAENAGGRVAIFSTEMTEEQNVARILANTTGINANVILSGQMNDNHKERVDAHKLAVAAKRLNIYDKLRDVDDIMAQCRKLAHSGGIDIVWIDFIQNLTRPGSKSPYEMFSQIAKDLQALAHDLRCTVVCLSQLPNHAGREDTGILEFKGAGEIAAACDVGVLMKRAKEDKTQILFDVRKNRHGKCGKYLLQFDNGWTRIIEKEAVE